MKKLFAISIILLFASTALAAPFLVCDPQSGVTHYSLTGPAWVQTQVTAQADGSIKMDVSPAISGVTTSLTVKACNIDPVWGTQCSASVPFEFTRPSAPVIPKLPKLIP